MSQVNDTVYSHFSGAPITYLFGPGDYLTGTNSYDDMAKLQYFNEGTGLPSQGYLTSVLIYIPYVSNSSGNFNFIIWNGDSTSITDTLKIVNIEITEVYANLDQVRSIDGAMQQGDTALYNYVVDLDIPIPAQSELWMGVGLPTSLGDSVAIASTMMGNSGYSGNYCAEIWSDGTFSTMPDAWGASVDIALAIFPVYTSSLASTENSENLNGYNLFPTESSDWINLTISDASITSGVIYSPIGQKVDELNLNSGFNSFDIAKLNKGIYFLILKDVHGRVLSTERIVRK